MSPKYSIQFCDPGLCSKHLIGVSFEGLRAALAASKTHTHTSAYVKDMSTGEVVQVLTRHIGESTWTQARPQGLQILPAGAVAPK